MQNGRIGSLVKTFEHSYGVLDPEKPEDSLTIANMLYSTIQLYYQQSFRGGSVMTKITAFFKRWVKAATIAAGISTSPLPSIGKASITATNIPNTNP